MSSPTSRCTHYFARHPLCMGTSGHLRMPVQGPCMPLCGYRQECCGASHTPFAAARQEHGIGQGFALFYIAHAAYLELRGSYKRAEAVFQAGLDRRVPVTSTPSAPCCRHACMHAALLQHLSTCSSMRSRFTPRCLGTSCVVCAPRFPPQCCIPI
jgi:hypothetical protein